MVIRKIVRSASLGCNISNVFAGFFFVGQGERTPPPKSISLPHNIFEKKGFYLFFFTRKIGNCFLGKIPSNFRYSSPGNFPFLPFPTWENLKNNPCLRHMAFGRCWPWLIYSFRVYLSRRLWWIVLIELVQIFPCGVVRYSFR